MGFNSFEFTNEVCENLYGNLNTLATSNEALELWTRSTSDLNTAWTTGDPNSAMAQEINNLSNKDQLSAFLAKYFSDSSQVDKFCSADISALLNKLAGPCWDDTKGSTWMSEIQTFGGVIDSRKGITTSTGDTETKAEGSFIQQSTSAQQPVSDLANAAVGILSTIAGILQQSFL